MKILADRIEATMMTAVLLGIGGVNLKLVIRGRHHQKCQYHKSLNQNFTHYFLTLICLISTLKDMT